MTEKEIYLGIGLPILAVLTSLIISLIQISGIRGDMRQMRSEFTTALADMRRDAREDRLNIDAALLEMRREAREDRLNIDAHIQLLTGKVYELMGQK